MYLLDFADFSNLAGKDYVNEVLAADKSKLVKNVHESTVDYCAMNRDTFFLSYGEISDADRVVDGIRAYFKSFDLKPCIRFCEKQSNSRGGCY